MKNDEMNDEVSDFGVIIVNDGFDAVQRGEEVPDK